MAYRSKQPRVQLEDWWLIEPTTKYPYWCIGWYDSSAEQTRSIPARPENAPKGHIRGLTNEARGDAYRALLSHVVLAKKARAATPIVVAAGMTETKSVPNEDLSVVQALMFYEAGRGATIKNRGKIPTTMKLVARVLGDPTCRQLTPSVQERLIAHLRAKGRSDRTVLDRLKMIWTAMYTARDKELLSSASIPARLPAKKWDPPAKLRSRQVKLADDQILAMFIAAAAPSSPESTWRWLIVQTGAVCRPSAPLLIRRSNFDAEVGNLVLLETDAVQEDNKNKATIRCCPTLKGFLQHWSQEAETSFKHRKGTGTPFGYDPLLILDENGNPIEDLSFHKGLAERAGVQLPKGTDSYIWRHTLITWLARHGVSEVERKFTAGHRVAGGDHGVYIHYEPDYMRASVQALEQLFAWVASKLPPGSRSLVPPAMVNAMDEQPEPSAVGQSYIHMLRRASFLVENRGYSVADFSEILSGIKHTSIAVEVPCGDQ